MVSVHAYQMSLVFAVTNAVLAFTGIPAAKDVYHATAIYKVHLIKHVTKPAIAIAYLVGVLVVCVAINASLGISILLQEGMVVFV